MNRCLSAFAMLTAFLLIVPAAWVQEKKEVEPGQKKGTIDLDTLFKKLDANGDGKIDPDEFKKLPDLYVAAPPPGGKIGGALKKLKDKLGNAGDIKLDADTLKNLIEQLGVKDGNFDPAQLQEFLQNVIGGLQKKQAEKKIDK